MNLETIVLRRQRHLQKECIVYDSIYFQYPRRGKKKYIYIYIESWSLIIGAGKLEGMESD
jgi:hypothetical protein